MDDARSSSSSSHFSPEQFVRYSRQIMLPGFGEAGQLKLRDASVLIVGLGGLASPACLYLAAAGVGRLGLLDSDVVELSNLHRQPLHDADRTGRPKPQSAAATLRALNPLVHLDLHPIRLTAENAREIIAPYDLVLDASDNFPTRYLTNDTCAALGKPLVYGSVFRFEGEVSVFAPRKGPCYRCLYPAPPPPDMVPDCAQAGVLGVLPGLVGILQAIEVIKYATGLGRPLIGRLLRVDVLAMTFREIEFERDADCPVCGSKSRPALPETQPTEETKCAIEEEITALDLEAALDQGQSLILLDVREPAEHEFCSIPGSVLIPLGELERRLSELPPNRPIIVYCRSGCRGKSAVRLLKERGFSDVRNLAGGILAWAEQVDPSLPRY